MQSRPCAAGIPSFLKHVPVLGDVLRGISVRAVKRLCEARRAPAGCPRPRPA